MKLVTYSNGSGEKPGFVDGENVRDLSGLVPSIIDLVRMGAGGLSKVREAAGEAVPLKQVRLRAPIRPGKILCSGINYKAHADENPKAVMPEEPFFFAKLPNALAGPGDEVRRGRSTQMDYEVEFSVVVGRRLETAAESEVLPAIFGYTLLNDISARDIQFKDAQITLGKNLDGYAPIGPWIVTTDDLPNPNAVGLRTRLNGETMQAGSTADWLFPLPRLISFLSHVMTLEPGDIVTTGTPAGIGFFRDPQVFMKPGDVIEVEAVGIGMLRNTIVA